MFALLFPLFSVGQTFVQPQPNEAFLQSEVAEVHITVSQSDLNTLLGDSLFSDHHFPGVFRYESASFSDTIQNIGFRVRGNTSRNAKKKGFKVNYLRQMNHNDLIHKLPNYNASLFASSCEALPFTIFEIHENDLPLLISDVSPMKDFFDNQIIKFDPLSQASVKSAFLKLFSTDIYSYNLSEYGSSLLNTTWKSYLSTLIDNLNKLKN